MCVQNGTSLPTFTKLNPTHLVFTDGDDSGLCAYVSALRDAQHSYGVSLGERQPLRPFILPRAFGPRIPGEQMGREGRYFEGRDGKR